MLEREELLALLDRLGSPDDADALQAARALDAAVRLGGPGWAALLAGHHDFGDDEDEDDLGDEEVHLLEDHPGFDGDPDDEIENSTDAARTAAIVENLLALPEISPETRDEIEGFAKDLATGNLEDSDRRYLRALHDRLCVH